ncbi:Zinc-type alcohol dehydrogenase-like protein PB24D3.08c [Grifola frondosa]|uniref:Zinc-type alcohol dehydrogenase-like protein PB24D3.08c n=1 Tax=Grifola frondosa TaxID=5627 RepID=A0A1C7MLQ9_GRIFR|nr:Zinc-type alcohol dehydrogenase-like protein PB24D3.08c [Grifola frondosa]
MSPVTNARVLFNEIPTGYPGPSTTIYDTSLKIDLENVPLEGGFLVKILVLSMDPYVRGRMRDPSDGNKGPPAFTLGEPMSNYGVGVILRSESQAFKHGDHLYGQFPFQQYYVGKTATEFQILKNEVNLPWSAYVGVCGMPGQTAYHGWKEFAHPKKGDVVFVTAGSGPVGATVIQLAKAEGLKVIASASTDAKVACYWDNVGGETLEAALDGAAVGARFIECGMMSIYNRASYHIKNLVLIFAKQLHISGFIVSSLHHKYLEQFYREIPPKVASGEIKYKEDVKRGLEKTNEALIDAQFGRIHGKSVIIVAEE